MFESLSERLGSVFEKLKGKGALEEKDVTEALLHSTAARVIDGVERIVALTSHQRNPATAPGPVCRWCPIQADCGPGQRYLTSDEAGEDW